MTEPPLESVREVGDSISLDCSGGGKPEPGVRWQRPDARPLPHGATQRPVNGTQRLSIARLSPAHHGLYQCVVENQVTAITRDAYIEIRSSISPLFPAYGQNAKPLLIQIRPRKRR